MLSRAQQILLKRAQQEAQMDDVDYRQAIADVSGMPDCRSSKDGRLTDRHVDQLLSYFEAIHWQNVDAGLLQPSSKARAIFRQPGFWAARNRKGDNSRERFTDAQLRSKCMLLESELMTLGFNLSYIQTIQSRIQPFTLWKYWAALNRTLSAKKSKSSHPF
jgi:hypothetical protein